MVHQNVLRCLIDTSNFWWKTDYYQNLIVFNTAAMIYPISYNIFRTYLMFTRDFAPKNTLLREKIDTSLAWLKSHKILSRKNRLSFFNEQVSHLAPFG